MSQEININLQYLFVHMLGCNKHLDYILFISVYCVMQYIIRNDVKVKHIYAGSN